MTGASDNSERFIQLLIDDGLIRREDWQIAQSIHKVQGGRLIEILLGLCPISEEDLYQATARQMNLPFWSEHELTNINLSNDLLDKFPATVVLEYNFLPIKWEGREGQRTLHLVIPNPLEHETLTAIRIYGQAAYLNLGVATPSAIVNSIQVHYKNRIPIPGEEEVEEALSDLDEKVPGITTGQHRGVAPPKLQLKECPACTSPQPFDAEHCSQCGSPMDLSQADPILGKTVGTFLLQSKLGEGGMGVVYRSTNEENQQEAAVKILRNHLTTNERVVKRFHREAQAQNQLRHENIVYVHDFGFEEGVGFFIAMEFLRGKSMEEILEENASLMTVPFVGSILRQVCDAMGFAHSRGIYHRDLKPDNIFLVDQGSWEPDENQLVKVLDFGVAKMVASEEDERLTRTGMTIGTPRYMAPEQAGDGAADHRSDIYSLGVILFEMLTGKSPFEGSSAYQIMLRHVYADPPALREVRPDLPYPPQLEEFIQRTMAKDPRKRPASMDMFWQELQPCLQILLREVGPATCLHDEARGPFRKSNAEATPETAEPPVIVGRMVKSTNPPVGPPGANVPTTMAPMVGAESSGWGAAAPTPPPQSVGVHQPQHAHAARGHMPHQGAPPTPPPATGSSGWLKAEDLQFWEDSFPEESEAQQQAMGGHGHATHAPQAHGYGQPSHAMGNQAGNPMNDPASVPFPGFADPHQAPQTPPPPSSAVRPSLLTHTPTNTPSTSARSGGTGNKPVRAGGLNLRGNKSSIREKRGVVQPRALKQNPARSDSPIKKIFGFILFLLILAIVGVGAWYYFTQMK